MPQRGQCGSLVTGTFLMSVDRASYVKSVLVRGVPMESRNFMASMACIEPITPGRAPIGPEGVVAAGIPSSWKTQW